MSRKSLSTRATAKKRCRQTWGYCIVWKATTMSWVKGFCGSVKCTFLITYREGKLWLLTIDKLWSLSWKSRTNEVEQKSDYSRKTTSYALKLIFKKPSSYQLTNFWRTLIFCTAILAKDLSRLRKRVCGHPATKWLMDLITISLCPFKLHEFFRKKDSLMQRPQ